MISNVPKNHLRITEMWAYISIDPIDDNEGVIGAPIGPNGEMMGLVGADSLMMEKLRPIVEMMSKQINIKIKLVKFTNRVEVGEIGGAA